MSAVPGSFNFHFFEVEESYSGYYTCICYGYKNPNVPLRYSDEILILVTGLLPKPSLQAHQQRRHVAAGGNVTLQCRKPHNMTEYKMFLLLKEGVSAPVQVQRSERKRADFSLRDVTPEDTGNYSCVYHQIGAPFWASDPSDLLEILVLGHLPKPSLQAHQQRRHVAAGGNVTLQCRKPHNMTEYKMFLLLKEGVSAPVQVQRSERNRADFSLHDVTLEDTGNYSCVYHQIGGPFWASDPSDLLEILVLGHLPKPSLQAHQQRRHVAAGGNVTLQCRKPHNMTEYKMFLLLKEGVSAPVQVQRSERKRADFSLRDVTPEDTGNYSCVYHQIGAPFWASDPSDLLEILVLGRLYPPVFLTSEFQPHK
ncbi:Immunoglobulin superfamily member 1 [Microtus ochrogaster]|nr:Immunoglobulin superfamily member 1 [Microtus ochrogaster]